VVETNKTPHPAWIWTPQERYQQGHLCQLFVRRQLGHLGHEEFEVYLERSEVGRGLIGRAQR
jgi:hypothetical protein